MQRSGDSRPVLTSGVVPSVQALVRSLRVELPQFCDDSRQHGGVMQERLLRSWRHQAREQASSKSLVLLRQHLGISAGKKGQQALQSGLLEPLAAIATTVALLIGPVRTDALPRIPARPEGRCTSSDSRQPCEVSVRDMDRPVVRQSAHCARESVNLLWDCLDREIRETARHRYRPSRRLQLGERPDVCIKRSPSRPERGISHD